MDDKIQPAERDKIILELFRDSFIHVAKCVKEELVLPEIQPKFPDLEDEDKKTLCEDEKYIDFKKKRDALVTRWGQHIKCAKKANAKAHECQQVLKRIWNIRKKFKINIESIELPTDEQQNIYLEHLKVLLAMEQQLKFENFEQNKLRTQTTDGQTPTASKEHMEEEHRPDKSIVSSKADTDSDNDDIQTTDNSRKRANKIEDEYSSHKAETESTNSGPDDTKSSDSFIENKEELERDQPMDTSDTNDVEVTKQEELGKLQKENEELKTKLKEKKSNAKKAKQEIQAKYKSLKDSEVRLKEANDLSQSLSEENERLQSVNTSFEKVKAEFKEANDKIQALNEENDRILKNLKLPDEKAKKMLTTLQKKFKDETKQKEDMQQKLEEQIKKKDALSQMCDKYKAACLKLQETKQTQDERFDNMQRPKTAPSRQYREMQILVETLKGEKESLMQRLSKVAGMKMKDNNPAIADLSDPNRPEKLSEKFREIYDNAWTNLLDAITEKTGDSDEIGVKQIVNALTMMYNTCKNTISNNRKAIAKLVGYPEDCFDKPYAGGKEGHDIV
ncbi:myosin-2 heavy chain-like isoform X2 [Mytilus californianus]|uniref:myosin-2 heavy chain-like isoform X2 n=1 Tax=Mytilus californianus TaxID=6549 RepID=UPI0022461B9C|nr:myosin-2 heavy chain-like isoform X2 [Mytilus californianus]